MKTPRKTVRPPWPRAAILAVGALLLPAVSPRAEERQETAAHWAFRPLRRGEPPAVEREGRVRTPVDRFVLRRLEEAGLEPSEPVGRRAFIRRVSFDLVGLPPTAEETDAFLSDQHPDARARLVDRLLASPRFGERWGRHWLDVARYADTKGYVFTAERRFPYSYTYRDYVIRAFNEDLPFDRFILEQLAADRLEAEKGNEALAAMGFLTLGRRFLNNTHDIIDDRIDVTTRGLMGLTVQCARCHDHKYDPISQKDYYALYGVFASSVEPDELPLIGTPEASEEYARYRDELARREKAHDDFLTESHGKLVAELLDRAPDYLLATLEDETDPRFGISVGDGDLKPRAVRRWREYIEEARETGDPLFRPWLELSALPAEKFAAEAASLIEKWGRASAETVNGLLLGVLAASPPATIRDVASAYGRALSETERLWKERLAEGGGGKGPRGFEDPAREALRDVLYGKRSPIRVPRDEAARYLDRATRNRLRELRKKIDKLMATSAGAPPRAMVLVDREDPGDAHVFVRGNPARQGEQVRRRFLEILEGGEPRPFEKGSGRLELARRIASPENPLTARVIANRVWLHHFGRGLVTTPSDFGLRSDPPSHPELLDWLAGRLIDSGWSLKELHRLIVLSSVYGQGRGPAGDVHRRRNLEIDPENRLLWKRDPRRLEIEPLRDALLHAAGALDTAMGGAAVDLFARPSTGRRTVYGFIERQNLPSVFRVFDLASPDATCPQRHETTVPQQALYLMNDEFVVEQARRMATRPDVLALEDVEERIHRLHEIAFGRRARPDEVRLGLEFVSKGAAGEDGGGMDRWARYAQVLLLSNEFAFVD